MIRCFLFLICSFSSEFLFSQTVTFQWAKQFGGGTNTFATAITNDPSGNVISTGYFDGSADFDPGSGTFILSASGTLDAFVTKLDANGNFLWAQQLNFPITGDGQAIASDASGNIYITGSNGPPPGGEDIYVSKFSSAGVLLWQKQIGSSLTDFGRSIALDASANVYVSGEFTGIVDFDPGAGTFTLNSGSGTENFILKLDASGNFVWAKHVASASLAKQPIAVSNVGEVYYTGEFIGITDFDPGVGTYTLTDNGNTDVFISKLDPSGNFVWVQQIGGASFDVGLAITADISGNIFVSGSFYGTVDLDPGPGTYTVDQTVNGNGFIIKMNSSGNMSWVRVFGGGSGALIANLDVDNSGAVYSTGAIIGLADFDPSAATFTLSPVGSNDIFIHKLDVSGNFVWVKQIGGSNLEYEGDISVDGLGNVYTNGSFQSTCDFDFGSSFLMAALSVNTDGFVHKLSQSGPSVINENIFLTNGLNLYPQPAGNFVNISLNNYNEHFVQIKIIDVSGKEILNTKSLVLDNNITLSTQNIANGIYILQLNSQNLTIQKRLIINR